ncbi:UDP-glucose 4-epimerase GalE [Escherichia coli]|uniref:UDP-glucose 4-epimerase GalE n=23 Tax=Enterobacteriaceae TaxID=543 RepID=UPI00376EA4F6
MNILVTGGAGYIGSHTAIELLNAGHEIIVLDNFSNASYKCIEKIKEITRRDFITITGDAGCRKTLSAIFEKHAIDIVIHFAGFKSVSESKSEPLKYYQNNVGVTITLLQVMEEYRIKKFIFSSSATVYGEPEIIPIPETAKIGGTTNPYGTSKYFVEKILEDVSSTGKLDIICLRYFNPVGAHSSGKIGEAPSGIPNNLVPYLLDVASGKRDKLFIYGNDYPTNDGTGVRDFIHVVDLAKGHLAAMNYLSINSGYNIFNLGTGKGYSVLELITTFEKLTNIKVNKSFIERRAGDVASCWADADKANSLLDWQAEQTLEQMLLDSWRWKKIIQTDSEYKRFQFYESIRAEKKILVLTPRFPYPVIGGDRLRVYMLCKELSKKYDLILLSLCDQPLELEININDSVFKEIHRVYLPKYKSYYNVLKALVTQKPLQIAYYQSDTFKNKYNKLIKQCDAVFCHLIRVADYVKDTDKFKILDMTDAISLNYSRVKKLASKKSLRAIIYSLEQKRLESYERSVANLFDLTTFISSVDRDYLYPNPGSNIHIVNNGVDTSALRYIKREIKIDKPVELIFIGNMYSLQNMDAAKHFAKNILPCLYDEFNIIFKVIGKISETNKNILNSFKNTIALGTVDDINSSASTGHIGICLVRLGAGVQNKILEYMALGLPCITSSIGYEGINAKSGSEIFVADTVEQYKNVLREIIYDYNRYTEVAENARSFVENNFSWESKVANLMNTLDEKLYEQ